MSQFSFANFKKIFTSFLSDLKTLFPEKSKDLDEWYSSLVAQNDKDFIDSVLNPLRKYSREIICNDDRMFNMPVQVSQKINLSAMWYTMKNMGVSKEDEKTFWTYLEQLYIVGNIAVKPQKEEQFLQVVENIRQKYGNKLPNEDDDEEEEDGGFNTESIEKATEQLQKIFGGNPVLNNLVQDIASNVGEKLKGKNQMMVMGKLLSGDHSMFGDVLSNMTQKYGDQLKNQQIDEKELQRKTQEVFKGFGGMFPGGAFPAGMFPGMPVPQSEGPTPNHPGQSSTNPQSPVGFPDGDDIINPNIPDVTDQNQMMAMQAQMQQMMNQLPPNMRKQFEKQMSQISRTMENPQANQQSLNQHPNKQQVKAVRSKQKPPSTTPEQNLKFAEDAGFTKYEFDLFEEALGGGNSIVHEHWWKGMREDFLNQPNWNDQAEHALTMMCRDGLGPALETILGEHAEWKRIVAKWET